MLLRKMTRQVWTIGADKILLGLCVELGLCDADVLTMSMLKSDSCLAPLGIVEPSSSEGSISLGFNTDF